MRTVRTTAKTGVPSSASNAIPSPALSPVWVPGRASSVVVAVSACTASSRGRMAFHAGRVTTACEVSKITGVSFGPGVLCTFTPEGRVMALGAPARPDRRNASSAEAATPGCGA